MSSAWRFVSVGGRVLLCTLFLRSAVGNTISNFRAIAGYKAKEGIPAPHLLLAGGIV